MTGEEVEAALRALNVGWDPLTGGIIHEDVATPECNAYSCGSYADMGTAAGSTAGEVALALRALIDGDRGPLEALMLAAADARG